MANYNAIEPNTVLGFKSGVQDDLNKYLIGGEKAGQAVEGVFYLTTDTHRLYIGRKSTDLKIYPVPVNQGILSVDSIDDLNKITGNSGEFYYVEAANILCIRSGDKWVQINPDNNTKITEFQANIETTSNDAKIVHTITTDEQDNSGKNIVYTSDFTIEGGDNVSVEVSGKKITISTPDDNNTINTDLTVTPLKGSTEPGASDEDKKTGYEIVITDSDGNTVKGPLDPEIKYGKNETSAKFRDNILTLDVYTTEEVDNLFKAADALVFKGVITDYSKLPETEVQNGYTYKIGTEFTHEGTTYKVGDILIAHGDEEDANGNLTTIQWVHIPAGDEVYTGGNLITITDTGVINHSTIESTKTTGNKTDFTFNVISSITPDSYGHIGAYEVTTVTVPQLMWDTF